jgi:hypothetical protein
MRLPEKGMKRKVSNIFHAQIEELAYQFWEERGRPLDSSEEDWFRAERELRHHFGPFPSDSLLASFSSFTMEPITQ